MALVARFMHIKKETHHRDLIDSEFGVLGVHRKGYECIGLRHLTATLTWDLETGSVVSHKDRSLDEFSHG